MLSRKYRRIIDNFAGMRNNDGRLAGLLGTVIIHLIAAIIFMSFKIKNLQQETAEIFTVEFEEVAPTENQEDRLSNYQQLQLKKYYRETMKC